MRLTRWDSLDKRFWAFVEKTDGCWLWTGPVTYKGYAKRIGHAGRLWYGHQLAYTLLVGPIPDGLVLDHLCRVRNCVNPAHLEPVTAVENTRRGALARWFETCPNGHNPSSRRQLPSGKACCVECRRLRDRERHKRDGEKRRAAARARYAKHGRRVGAK